MTIVSSSDGNRPVKAIRQIVEIGAGIEVEGFMLPDGSYRLSKTSAAFAIGKPRNSVVTTFGRRSEMKHLAGMEFEKIHLQGNNRPIDAMPIPVVMEYWWYWARQGNQKARELIDVIGRNPVPPFEAYGGNYIVFTKSADKVLKRKPPKKSQLHSEDWYVSRLRKQLGGEREVVTPAGNIDLLTSTELIEVKEVKGWKCAIGQVEIYGDYYPSHTKRIHLFGAAHERFLKMVEEHCLKRGIVLTWEA
jgi:hypothetical protein